MSFDHWRRQEGPVAQRHQSDSLFASDTDAAKIENMVLTAEGSLRTVVGPLEYDPTLRDGTSGAITNYKTPFDGVCHCLLGGGQRDVLLVVGHIKTAGASAFIYGVWEHQGWDGTWRLLIGDDASASYRMSLIKAVAPQFQTQFTVTPNGVVITPQERRTLFYDGYTVAELGYAQRPGPPSGLGPKAGLSHDEGASSGGEGFVDVPNSRGYAHSSVSADGTINTDALTWGNNRLGFISPMSFGSQEGTTFFGDKTNSMGGVLEPGEWRARIQWIDRWGNLSPLSNRSNPVGCARQENVTAGRDKEGNEDANRMMFAIAWTDLATGPEGTVGRILSRTKDQINSGIPDYFEIPAYATEASTTFATIEDNRCGTYPDNIPDTWLILKATEVDPVPTFRLSALALGRMWVANYGDGVGMGAIRASMPGRWGTFEKNGPEIYPDTQGSNVTALHTIPGGLLAFTAQSCFIITTSDSGEGFRAATLSSAIGCVGPNAIATMPGGKTVWLSRNGVFTWDGKELAEISGPIRRRIKRLNGTWLVRACAAVDTETGEFRLWVAEDGSTTNNICLVYDGVGWRERTDVTAHSVCTTRDARQLMLALGTASASTSSGPVSDHPSLWVLDREASTGKRTKAENTAVIESHWLRANRSNRKASPHEVTVWLREAGDGDNEITIDVMRDWRNTPKIHTETRKMRFLSEDPPLRWDNVKLAGTEYNNYTRKQETHTWRERRAYWTKINIVVPSCEVFKIRLTGVGDWEYVAMEYSELDRNAGKVKAGHGRSDR
mgnify:CR=1 FL=1